MPVPPRTVTLVPTSEQEAATWRFMTKKNLRRTGTRPISTTAPGRKDPPALGRQVHPEAQVRTTWNTPGIWLRRTFDLSHGCSGRVALRIHHDEDVDVYLNGQRVLQRRGYTTAYETEEIASSALQPGRNVIAIHCRQTGGGQYIDAGLDAIVPGQ